MASEVRRRTPEELLREVQAEESAAAKGRLKIFLGYASGVGKSFRMLDEARRRRLRGEDVVVGAIQPQISDEVAAILANLEVIPLKTVGAAVTMDADAIRRRHPAVCVIDGLAYDNPDGSVNASRWQDVQDLLDAGIAVIGSMNIQYVEELGGQVEAITGKHVAQTVPVAFLRAADEIEIVDLPPEEPGARQSNDAAEPDTRQAKLSKLRELALVLTADVVDRQLTTYLECHGIHDQFGAHERILVCVTPRANVAEMIGMGSMIAGRFHGELIAAYVNQPAISAADQAALDEKLALAQQAGARIEILDGEDLIETILDFAKAQRITQLFIGHSQRTGFRSRILGSPVDKLIQGSRGIDIRVFPQ